MFFKAELDRRKKTIQEFDQQRKKNAPLDEIEQEAKDEAEYMLKRANDLRQEQEDEVKHLNEVCFPTNLKISFEKQIPFSVNSQCEMSRDTRRTSSRKTTN